MHARKLETNEPLQLLDRALSSEWKTARQLRHEVGNRLEAISTAISELRQNYSRLSLLGVIECEQRNRLFYYRKVLS